MAEGFVRKIVINQELKPINPFQCGKQKCPASYSFGPRIRDFWLLHFVMSGKGIFINQNGTHKLKENELFVIRPYENTYYEADANDPWNYVWIGFTTDIQVPAVLKALDTISAPYLRGLFLSAYDDVNFNDGDNGGAYEYYLCGVIWQIFGMLMRESEGNATVNENYIKPAISIIKSEYQTSLTVSNIAERLHISKGYLSDIFKRVTGVPPKKYLNDFRMKKAVELITKKNLTITVTASVVGFTDVFAFSRAFKNYYKCSPSDYVKKYGAQYATHEKEDES